MHFEVNATHGPIEVCNTGILARMQTELQLSIIFSQ